MDKDLMPGTTDVAPPDASRDGDSSFQLLFHGMPGPALLIDTHDEQILDLNPAFAEALQYDREALLGQNAGRFPFWGHPRRWRALIRSHSRQGPLRQHPIDLLRRDGTLLGFHLSIINLGRNGRARLLMCLQPRTETGADHKAARRYHQAFMHSGEAQLIIDLNSRRLLEANPRFEPLTGLPASQHRERTLDELGFLPPDTSDSLFRRVIAEGALEHEQIRVQLPGDRAFEVLLYARIVQLDGRRCLLVTARDITHQLTRDRALEESRTRLKMALDAGQMGIWDWQIRSDALHCSARSAELHGYAANDWDGSSSHFLRGVLSEDRRAIRRAFVAICRGGQPRYRLTYRVLAGQQQRWLQATATLHLDEHGRPARMVGTLMDISDQRRNQTALVESEAKFAMLFQNAPDPYCLVHSQSQRIIEVNQSFARTFGYPAASLIGRTPEDIGLWSQHPAHQNLQMAARGERELRDCAETFATDSGRLLLCEVATTRLRINHQQCVLFSFRDITARTQAESALRASEDKFARAFKGSPDSISISELKTGRYLEVNDGFCRLSGYKASEAIGRTALELNLWSDPAERDELVQLMAQHGSVHHREMRMRARDGQQLMVAVSAQPLTLDGLDCMLLTVRDITEQKRIEARVKHLAYHDALTNLPNRLLLSDRLSQLNALYQRHALRGALLFFDLDHFKHINDSLGHSCGDAVLQEVTRRLLSRVRAEDTVSRLGGDEFVVLLSGFNSSDAVLAQEVERAARELLVAISAPMQIEGHTLQLSASIGIALIPDHGDSAEDLLKRADIALYRVKERGRDGIAFFEQSMQVAASERLAIESELRRAISEGQFCLYYQPQFDYRSRRIQGAESLLRWNHPKRGLIGPGAFMDVLEQSSLILEAGRQILNQACAFISRLLDQGLIDPQFSLSVNISPRQFRHASFVDDVLGAINEYQVPTSCLNLEITEGIVIENINDTIDKMNVLRGHGVHFAIDDFGTGYSSLTYLKRLPVDLLKIDQSFVNECTHNANDAEIIRAIIAIASSLHLGLIAEGVEEQAQLHFLHSQGCEQFQGYLFGRPMDAEQFSLLLSNPPDYDQL